MSYELLWIDVSDFTMVKTKIASFTAMSSSTLIFFVLFLYDQVPPVVVPGQTASNLFWKHPVG